MLLWFAGLSFGIVWQVFRDPAFDYRLVVAGALLPDLVDGLRGGARELHTLAASVLLLVIVMVVTRGRRRARRRWLALPIGTFVHLLLDGVWSRTELFGWPAFGWSLAGQPLPSLDHGWAVVVLEELAGLAVLAWAWRRFRLDDPARRRLLLRTGHLDRDLAGGPPPHR